VCPVAFSEDMEVFRHSVTQGCSLGLGAFFERLGLDIIRLVYIELQSSNFNKNLYSIEILGCLSISAENRDFCPFLNS